jgi:hypothetical protein
MGTAESPFLIKDAMDLIDLGKNVRNGMTYYGLYFRMENDIDLLDCINWTPMGGSTLRSFRGIFDGNGHIITNLKIGTEAEPAGGYAPSLFGYVSGGTIKNLGMGSSCAIYGLGSPAAGIAAWVGDGSVIFNC